jgi:sugar O-acyltransferase (sialic acid O-acetyltransferase NeuD family)
MTEFHTLKMPKLSANDDQGYLAEWSKQPGNYVNKGEVLCLIETTKSVSEVEAPANGYFSPVANTGDQIEVGGALAVISSEPITMEEAQAMLSDAVQTFSPPIPVTGQEAGITLKARLLAQQHGLDLTGLGQNGKRITEDDVRKLIDEGSRAQLQGLIPQASQPQVQPAFSKDDLMDGRYPGGRYPGGRPQKILIIGGGDGAVQVLDVIAKLPYQRAVAILDDNPGIHGKTVGGVPIIGKLDLDRVTAGFESGDFDAVVISISTIIKLREDVFSRLKARGVRFANIIHPSVVIGSNVNMGEGNVIMAFTHIGACATLGDNNFLSAYCSIEHHGVLGNHCSFGPGVVTSSRVTFGDRVRCGTGIFIEPKISIGADAVIGSGCIIWKDVPERSTLKSKLNYFERRRDPIFTK